MKFPKRSSLKYFAVFAVACVFIAGTAVAGPPLICHSIDIGSAQSLPWSSSGWNLTGQETYNVDNLVQDTLALLGPSTPVLVRMETLRRATLYAQQRSPIAKELLFRLEARTRENPKDALAAFDFGYLVECYRQASWLRQHTDWLKASADATTTNFAMKLDGYQSVQKAIALRGTDPQMEFAAALMTIEGSHEEHDRHLQNAMAGAKADALLARNLASRFPKSAA
jgi:hypothetical protein